MDILTTDVILKIFNECQIGGKAYFLAVDAVNAGHAKDPQVLLMLKLLYDSELISQNIVRKNVEMLWSQRTGEDKAEEGKTE